MYASLLGAPATGTGGEGGGAGRLCSPSAAARSGGGGDDGDGGGCRGVGGDLEAASLVPLHVAYPSDRLDLRQVGIPVVPVLEFALLEDKLTPPISWVHVAHPPAGGDNTGNISQHLTSLRTLALHLCSCACHSLKQRQTVS